jgi:hypothetical protein
MARVAPTNDRTRRGGRRLAAAWAVAVFLAAACSDAPSGATAGSARLRVINGATSTVGVYVDGTALLGALSPATVSPPLPVAPGARRVELRPAGGAAGASAQVDATVAETTLVAALGTTPGSVTAMALPDTGAIPAPGMSKLQAVHLAARAPAIWVWRKQPDFPTPVTFMFPHPYGMSTSYIQSTPGTWEVYVTREGVNPSVATLAHLSVPVAANQARRVAVLDSAGGVRLTLLDAP